jgi:enterochelin esterase-like enzyme
MPLLSKLAARLAAGAVLSIALGSLNPPLLNAAPPAQSETTATAAHGAIAYKTETYSSAVLGMPRNYGVILPPNYDQHPNQRYPVVVLLHGGHGDEMDWLKAEKGNAVPTVQALYDAKKLPPSIIITPDGNDKRGTSPYFDPQYIDGPNGNVASALGDELVKVIQKRYRTMPTPDFWAIGGLSSGGWGALNIGLHYPRHFAVLFSHSGYFVDKSGPENSPMSFVKTLPNRDLKKLAIYIDTGSKDGHYVSQAKKFQQVLEDLGITNTLQVFPGSHTWRFWREHLADSLTFVGSQFQKAQAASKR